MPLTYTFLHLHGSLDFRKSIGHLLNLLAEVSSRCHEDVLKLHLLAPLLILHILFTVRLVLVRRRVEVTVNFLAFDVMKFELFMSIRFTCFYYFKSAPQV